MTMKSAPSPSAVSRYVRARGALYADRSTVGGNGSITSVGSSIIICRYCGRLRGGLIGQCPDGDLLAISCRAHVASKAAP